jgi:hypothetical protein
MSGRKKRFVRRIRGSIVFVCSDMWESYLKVIREKCSEALHILDRFHIVAKMNKDTLTILSVHRRLLYVVNHERFDRSFSRFEFQAEPFRERSEYRISWVRCRGAAISVTRPKRAKRGSLSRKLDAQIESACDSGLVEYQAA